jgi:cytoskeletal protein CcmA (bactofilin family)
VVFRKENKVDAFQRQISALRQQLGTEEGQDDVGGEGEDPGEAGSREEGGPRPDEGTDFVRRESSGYSFAATGYGASRPPEFAPEPEAPALPVLPRPVGDAETSVVAHDAAWKGDFETNGSVHVHGRFEGSITAKRDVYVAEEADVDAAIAAENVIVAGLVKGTIRCDGRFEVLPQGRITADVQSPTLVIHEGARITGQFRMGPAEAATVDQAPPPVVHRRSARGG